MTDIFTADFFINNRKNLQQEMESKLIVLAANGLVQRSADTTFPFRQDSNFWYLTGIEEPDYILVIEQDEAFLIAPKRADHRDQWDGAIDRRAIKSISGIKQIVEYHEGWTKLDILLKKHKKVHTVTPVEAYYDHFGFFANPSKGVLLESLSKHRKLEQVDIRNNIARLRQIKQPLEIQAIQAAIDITASSMNSVRKKLIKYTNERQIVADMTKDFINAAAEGHAYQPIVAAGGNATTIHYIKNNHDINPNDLVLLDVGAEVCGYSADITRTYSVGQPSKRQLAIYEAVKRVQEQAFAMLGPGIDIKKYEKSIDKIMAKELKFLGLIDDIDDKKGIKKYYPHLTSHFLGLDTHDAADYKRPLMTGMVLTVEPGIYVPQESIGVRIEDDVLITDDGIKILSSGLSTSLY